MGVRAVGPGEHYLGHSHTQTNFERAFFFPIFFDNNSIAQRKVEGQKDFNLRALEQARHILAHYQEPTLDQI